MNRLRIHVEIDSRPPFDGERYWRWVVFRESADGPVTFAMGWCRTKRDALQLARTVRQEIVYADR